MKIEISMLKLAISEGLGHSVELVDSTDNGSFLFAEVQVAGHRIGDIDVQALVKIRLCDLPRHLEPQIELMKKGLASNFFDAITCSMSKDAETAKGIYYSVHPEFDPSKFNSKSPSTGEDS